MWICKTVPQTRNRQPQGQAMLPVVPQVLALELLLPADTVQQALSAMEHHATHHVFSHLGLVDLNEVIVVHDCNHSSNVRHHFSTAPFPCAFNL